MSSTILNRLHKASLLSSKSSMLHQHGAVVYNKNKLISMGYNHYQDDTSRHAEQYALDNLFKKKRQCFLWKINTLCS
jgi:pyrimidine deaminase RibD-like protein